ncbi:MAG TPA: NADH-quinone oxidoreductase subunit N [Acidobacteriota bacterium]|nr:NADH-quinone oxidoreductase subunit N [Acidobacteriota bacterium]
MFILPELPKLQDYVVIIPEICITLTAFVIMMYDAFSSQDRRRDAGVIALAGIIGAGGGLLRLWNAPEYTAFGGMFVSDQLRLYFVLIFLVVAALAVLASMQFLDDERLPPGEFYTLLMFATVGMMLMAAAGDLATLFLGLETLSITTYVLAGYRRGDVRSNESALKYFILGSFSTGFLLYGIALTYGATKTTNLARIHDAILTGDITSMPLLMMGAAMMLIGLSFKVATVPFHLWTPDVYQGAPTAVTAFMAAGPKAAAFVAFLRVFVEAFAQDTVLFGTSSANTGGNLYSTWTSAVVIIAIMSMIIGNVVAITQTNIKRMLAYSSIAHAGYGMVGILGNDWKPVAFYMLAYAVTSMGAFTVISLLARQGDEKTEIDDFAGIGFQNPGLSVLLMIFLLSLGGIPLTAGFIGKFVVFKQAWFAGYQPVVIIGVLTSAVSLYYYLRPLVVMFFQNREGEYVPPRISFESGVALAAALLLVFGLGDYPEPLLKNKDKEAPAAAAQYQSPVEKGDSAWATASK